MQQNPDTAGSPILPPLVFLTDKKRCPDPLPVIDALPPGTGVILRDYRAKDRKKLAETIARACRARDLVFLVGADPALAREVGADGLHLPEWALMGPARKQHFDENWLLTASVHSVLALRRAEALGVNAVFLAPAFPTKSHPGKQALGVHGLRRLARQTDLQFYPLGGISEKNLQRIPKMKNMAGFAGISFFMEKS